MTDQQKSGPGLPKPKMQTMTRHTLQAQTAQPQRRPADKDPAEAAADKAKGGPASSQAKPGRSAPPAAEAQKQRQPAPAELETDMAEEDAESDDEYNAWAAENPEEAENLERITIGMAKGEISPAEAYGFSIQDMAEAAVLGSEQLEAGNLESAVIIFEGLVTAEPKIPQFRASLGQCYEKLGYNEEALESYASALILYAVIDDSKYEDILDVALLRAILLVKLERELEAIEDLTRVVPPNTDLDQAPPALVQSYVMLMNLLEKAAKKEEELAAAAPPAGDAVAPEAPPA